MAGGAGYTTWKGKFSEDRSVNTDFIVETVKRAPLDISIVERGSLESANNMVLTSKVEGDAGTNIIMIVEEGTAVKEGDVLVELDSAKLRADELQQKIVLTNAKAVMDQALKNVDIQKAQNESDIAAADLAQMLADLDLEKYDEGDYVLESKIIDGERRLANEEFLRAQDKLAFTQRLIKKGYATQTELEADRIAVEKARVALEGARAKDAVLQNYTRKRMLEEKKANKKEAGLQLERVRLKADAALAQYVSDYNSKKLTYESEDTKYKKLLAQLDECKIIAPRDGMVVYANTRSGGRSSDGPLIYEGARVKERQAIIHLPDITQMRVNARIHESKIAMVIEGLPATIRCDAEPGEIFHGEVDMVSLVPASGSWPNFNLKEYVTFVKLTDDTSKISKLKPGLTAEVEILIDRLVDVLQAPLQSFVERGGRHFAWIVRGGKIERREVKLGKANEAVQQIVEDESLYAIDQGLKEGDSVVLNPRTVLPKEVVALEEEIAPLVQGPAIEGKLPPEASPGAAGPRDGSPGRRGESSGGDAGGGRKKGGGGGGDPSAAFARFDTDQNGKLSEDEMPPPLKGSFAVLDANGDKSIDKEEWQKGAASMSRGGDGGGGGRKGEGKTAGAGGPVAGG